MSALGELSGAVAGVVAAAAPSVVGVGHSGSGAVVADGVVVTNAHNVIGRGHREGLSVSFDDGTSATAELAGADLGGDLAVLTVPTAGRPPLEWSSAEATLGQLVVGLSRPAGRGLRVGVGFVSGLGLAFRGPEGSTITGALEHSAPLARGSSGGPLLAPDGRLVALNTHREGDALYLAIPASTELKNRVDALARGEVPRRARLGVALAPPQAARHLREAVGLPPRDGLLVRAVDPDGPAGRAGVRVGDLIVSVGGRPVLSVEDLAGAVQSAAPSGACSLLVVRGVDEVAVSVPFDLTGGAGGDRGTA